MTEAESFAYRVKQVLEDRPSYKQAIVTDEGNLNIVEEFSPAEALSLARWIVATFSDDLVVAQKTPQRNYTAHDYCLDFDEKWGAYPNAVSSAVPASASPKYDPLCPPSSAGIDNPQSLLLPPTGICKL